jgi:hypothetical protein
MARVLERQTLSATLILNLEDAFVRQRLGAAVRRRPLEPLRFSLVERVVGGVTDRLTPPRDLVVTRNASGYHLFFGRERLRDGSTTMLDMSDGSYTIEITSPSRFYQTVRRTFAVPMPNPNIIEANSPDPVQRNPMLGYSVDLEPGHAYPFPDSFPVQPTAVAGLCADIPAGNGLTLLRGSLHDIDGTGIAAARLQVTGASNQFETGETGEWVLWFADTHPSGPVTVTVTLPPEPPFSSATVSVPGVCVVRGRETSLHETSLRGWVRRAGVGVGGAEVRVSGRAARSRSIADGGWRYYFGLDQLDEIVDVTAVLPSGEALTRQGVAVKRRGTTVVPAFTFV